VDAFWEGATRGTQAVYDKLFGEPALDSGGEAEAGDSDEAYVFARVRELASDHPAAARAGLRAGERDFYRTGHPSIHDAGTAGGDGDA
jgi:hypothetical protein